MADMLCMKCSEPWDYYGIRNDIVTKKADWDRLAKRGGMFVDDLDDKWEFGPGPVIRQCPACYGKNIEPDDNAKIRAELARLYGEDVDGFIVDMEDVGLNERYNSREDEG